MKTFCLVVSFVLLLVLNACSTTQYKWDEYDEHLYEYYKDPLSREKFATQLLAVIKSSEKAGKVPPGIYAEYGYILLESKNPAEACVYFKKEAAAWPEAEFFMQKMIRNSSRAPAALNGGEKQ